MQSHERSASWWTAGFTGLIFLVTAIYATVAFFQMRAMNRTVQQTQTLIEQQKESLGYAKTQAEVAVAQKQAVIDSADAAKTSAKASADMADQNKDLIRAARTQADASLIQAKTSQVSARAAEKSASLAQIGLLPRITATLQVVTFESGKEMKFVIDAVNKGGTTALNYSVQAHILRFNRPLPLDEWRPHLDTQASVLDFAPQSNSRMTIESTRMTPEEFRNIKEGTRQLRIWLWGTYDTEIKRQKESFAICFMYSATYKEFGACSREEYNESKPN